MKIFYIHLGLLPEPDMTFVSYQNDNYQLCGEIPADISTYRLVVFLPALLISHHQLNISAPSSKQQQSAIPFALSQQISQNIEDVSYRYKINGDQVNVSVIEQAVLNKYLVVLSSLGIKADYLLSEAEVFAEKENNAALYAMNEIILKQNDKYYGLNPVIAEEAMRTVAQTDMTTYATEDVAKHYQLKDSTVIENSTLFLAEHCSVHLKDFLNFATLFSARQVFLKKMQPYWMFASLLLILAILYPLSLGIKGYQQEWQSKQLQQAMANLYQQVRPGDDKVADPYTQLLSQVKKQQQASGKNFLSLLKSLEDNFHNAVYFDALQYQRNILSIKVYSEDLAQLEQFKTNLEQQFNVVIKQHTQEQQTTKMTLELKKRL